jgi:hypothetical protein
LNLLHIAVVREWKAGARNLIDGDQHRFRFFGCLLDTL